MFLGSDDGGCYWYKEGKGMSFVFFWGRGGGSTMYTLAIC